MLSPQKAQRSFSMDVASYDQPREKSKRPQLSCNSCRARKVKCDRLQPCSACSLHQSSGECHYDLTDSERKPILQAEALRAKDREIAWLKEQIQRLGGSCTGSDRLFDRKKRKAMSYTATTPHGIRTSPPQYHSPASIERPRCQAQYVHAPDQTTPHTRKPKRAKPPIKAISVPVPDTAGLSIARPSPSKQQQHWHAQGMGSHQQLQWSLDLKRSPQAHPQHGYALYDASKFSPSEIGNTHRHEPSALTVSRADDEVLMQATQPPKLWPSCFSDGTESLTIMSTCGSMANTAAFIPLDNMPPATTALLPSQSPTLTSNSNNAYCYRSSSMSTTPSPASCPSSTYAQSASSSALHTPSASHPVSPSAIQQQPYCHSQPPSPMWDFDNRGNITARTSHAEFDLAVLATAPGHLMYTPSSAANSSSGLITQLTACPEPVPGVKEDPLGPWSWNFPWASPSS